MYLGKKQNRRPAAEEEEKMKRILTIQDISCFGKCSTTIALPILSAMGIETAVLPTAILSTHTMFADYIKRDLTDAILPFAKQWRDNGVKFDAIYTGYLGTVKDIELVMSVIDLFRNDDTMLFVDPVFGDHARTYAGISEDYAAHCAQLCRTADYVVPNITEACLMTGAEYKEEYDEDYALELAQRVCGLGAANAVLTGVSYSGGTIGYQGLNRKSGQAFSYQNKRIDILSHGTGDLLSAAAAGALVCGKRPELAFRIAADYTAETIRVTKEDSDDPRYGIHFESTIPLLLEMMGKA